MAKPLRTEETRPKSVQFSHFGVLDEGKRSKGAAITSIVVNGLILAIILILGAIVKTSPKLAKQLTELTLPPEQPPAPKPPVRPPPPPPKPLPTPPKLEPRITPPEPVPELKPLPTPVMPKPAITPAPPKAVTPPPAPVHVNLANPAAAAMAHNDPAPTAIRLGSATNPINNTSGPAVSNINLGRSGAPGMNAGNTGLGANATKINLGSGSPNSQAMNGTGRGGSQITGVKLGGVTGGTYGSKGSGTVTTPVVIGSNVPPPAAVSLRSRAYRSPRRPRSFTSRPRFIRPRPSPCTWKATSRSRFAWIPTVQSPFSASYTAWAMVWTSPP